MSVFARLWFGDSFREGESSERASGEVARLEDYGVIGDGELVTFENKPEFFSVDWSDNRLIPKNKSDSFA